MNELDRISSNFSSRVVGENHKSAVIFGHVLTMLEHFKFQVHKFKFLGYCDYQMAYFCFHSSRRILNLMEDSSKKSLDALFKNIQQTMEALQLDYLEMERLCQSNPALRCDLQSRLNILKSNGDISIPDELSYETLKYRDLISARELNSIMRKSPERVLLIDFRSRREFEYSHINYSAVVNIEPQVVKDILGQNATANDQCLENALSNTLDAPMLNKFRNRHKFDLIVFYNLRYGLPECNGIKALEHALIIGDTHPFLTSNPFISVIDLITYKFQYFSSKVKQYPLILNGGLETWHQTFGEAGLARVSTGTNKNKLMDKRLKNEVEGSRYLRNFGDYFSSGLSQTSPLRPQPKSDTSGKSAIDIDLSAFNSHYSATKESKNMPLDTKKDKMSHSSPSESVVISFSTGLTNLGNSCYMNCVLQCLAATPPLIDFLMKTVHERNKDNKELYKQHINFTNVLGTKGMVTSTFVNLLTDMCKKNGTVFSPKNFKKVIGSISPSKQFATSDQQDCIEFLNFILDSLHEDLNQRSIDSAKERSMIMDLSSEQESAREILPIRLASTIEWERYLKINFSIIVDYFQGQYLSQLKCLECNLTSTTFNAFSILSLPIPEKLSGAKTVSLSECLDLFLETELLDENNKWHCPKCKKFTKSTKKITITRLPRVLIIHFKRFKFDAGYFKKLENLVTYPVDEVLDMTKYWPRVGSYMNPSITPVMDGTTEQDYITSFPLRNQVPPFEYKLYGVANHFGNLTTGHYTSFVQKKDKNNKSEWCYFDDAKVQHGVASKDVLNSNAYCLFYRRI